MPLGIVDGDRLLELPQRIGMLSERRQGDPCSVVGQHQKIRILSGVAHVPALLGELLGRPVLGPRGIEDPQSPPNRKKLWRLASQLADFASPRIDLSHLWRSESFGRDERRADRKLERKLLLEAVGTLRQGVEQFLRLGEVGDRFRVRRPPHRLLGRSLEIRDCGFSKIRAGIVVREDLGLGLRDVRILLPQRLGDLAVVMLPVGPEPMIGTPHPESARA